MNSFTWVYLHLCEWSYSEICDKLCIQRFYRNHLKSQTHTNIIRERQQLNESFQLISVK